MSALSCALVLAMVWLSPAALLGLGPLVLSDGASGLWASLVLGSGALLATLLLAGPWGRRADPAPLTLLGLVGWRWPTAGRFCWPLAVGDAGTALLFLWAQLAAGRLLGLMLGWSPALTVGVLTAILALAARSEELAPRWAALGSGLACLALTLPLLVVVAGTTPRWPAVWAEVASRPRVAFTEGSRWTTEGHSIRRAVADAPVSFTEEQRVVVLGRGRVRIEHWEGGETRRDVTADTELTLRSGDRLAVPDGVPLRFQPGRRIPGAPASGPEWLDPAGRHASWRGLSGLGVSLLLGALGLSAVHAALPASAVAGRSRALPGAALAVLGLWLATGWALYAAWLTPEIYIGGVAGVEIYELPGALPALGAAGPPLRALALAGLAVGGLAAGIAVLGAVPGGSAAVLGPLPVSAATWRLATLGIAGALAWLVPTPPWTLLLAAFGLGAAVGAPAAVMACWAERVTARGLAVGAGVGLALFVGLSLLGALGVGAGPDPDGAWLGWLTAWPALVAVPANALTARLWGLRPAAVPTSPLPPGLFDLHE